VRRICLPAALVLIASMVIGCGSGGPKTYTTSNTNITANVGEQFVIKLASNKTTGFQWSITGSLDTAVVKKVKSAYIAGKSTNNEVGVGGVEQWTFEAVGAGTTKIVMVYSRPFEKGVQPAQTVTFNVTVQ
jgi:inhibitor of cysteine peptidase